MHFRDSQNRGQVIQKLNKVIEFLLDKGTQNTMLLEPWTDDFVGDLAECTKLENGKCTPIFDNQFEAQYYCEWLGEDCVGVHQKNGEFTTMRQIVHKSKTNSTSSVKAMWCSDSTPPFTVKLPSVFSASNQVRVVWPVVNLKEMFVLMGKSSNSYLSRTWDDKPMTQANYNRFGLDIVVMADTVIVDNHFTVYNVRSLKIIARKLIIQRPTIMTFRQVTIISAWDGPGLETAAKPDPGKCKSDKIFCNGTNGEHGEHGFMGTIVEFEFGCVNGDENDLQIETFSGNGSNGQHASNGLPGQDGVKVPPKDTFVHYNYCGLTDSCTTCCHGLSDIDWYNKGENSVNNGTDGGNGGNGGNGGAPGKFGSISMKVTKGLPQQMRQNQGDAGKQGHRGHGGKKGKQGIGGFGEKLRCEKDSFSHTKCKRDEVSSDYVGYPCDYNKNVSSTCCHADLFCGRCPACTCDRTVEIPISSKFPNLKVTQCQKRMRGFDGPVNKAGSYGNNGKIEKLIDSNQIYQQIDAKYLISADIFQQDFMLKYAVMLMNNETINESQEILYFLTKFKSVTGATANQLLNIMNKDGKMESDVKVVPKQNYEVLYDRLSKTIKRGQQLEEALMELGHVFEFTHMFYSLVDTVLQVVEDEMTDIRVEKREAEEIVIDSYNSMVEMNKAMELRTYKINDDIERLVFYINAQINSLQRAAQRQKRMSCVGAVFSCIPGIPKTGVKGAVGNSAKAYAADTIMKELDNMECEELSILSFLNEFIYDFGQLGDDVACLRTPEDFKNFNAGSLREFFSGDLKANLEGEGMWMDVECLLGLVSVPNNPPNFGLLPDPSDFFPLAAITDKIAKYSAIIDSVKIILQCLKEDSATDKSKCFIHNCAAIVNGVNQLLDTGVDCKLLSFE